MGPRSSHHLALDNVSRRKPIRGRKKRKVDAKRIQHLLSAIMVFAGIYVAWIYAQSHIVTPWHASGDRAGKEVAEQFYGEEVLDAARKYDLDYSYLMALLMLECSGEKPAGARFEPHVFNRLKEVRDGKRSNYENVKAHHLQDASDDALRNLATSWGPFQLMGYKCILLGVKIRDIRGTNGVEHGAKWIHLTYGNSMRKSHYRDCFHLHNTGLPFPKSGLPRTHDPQYVPRGLAMMKQFVPPGTASLH